MKKRIFLLFSILFLWVIVSAVVSAATINVPGNYASIQAAINNATAGDTINVSVGTYNEDLVINKTLILQGAGAANTIIDLGQPSETTGIWVLANNVIFSGFTVRNISMVSSHAQYAIRVRGSSNKILDNIIIGQVSRDWYNDEEDSGINLDGTTETITSNNIVENNEVYGFSAMGIQVVGSGNYNAYNNLIQRNNIHNIDFYAIANDRSGNQIIQKNTFNNIGPSGYSDFPSAGIIVWGEQSAGTKIENQEVSNTGIGIAISAAKEIGIKNNTLKNNTIAGIRLSKSSWLTGIVKDNIIVNNTITKNYNGITISSGNSTQIGANNLNWNDIAENLIGVNNSADSQFDASYNWWGDCSGPSGIGPGIGDSITGNASYTPWLGACIKNKDISPNCVLATDSVTLYANVSSLVCVGNVTFSINKNGTWQNYTGIGSGSGIYSVVVSGLVEGINVYWTVYVDDCYGHMTKNGNESFHVNKRTNLAVSPSAPDGMNNWYVTEPIFTLTNPNASQIFYRWGGGTIKGYVTPFNLSEIPNPPPQTAGILELNWRSNLSCNRMEPEQNQTFHIDLTTPLLESLSPAENAVISCNTKLISAIISDIYGSNSGIDKDSVVFKLDGIIRNATKQDVTPMKTRIAYTPSSGLGNWTHLVEVYGQDNAGNPFYKNWSFSVNLTSGFGLNVLLPENKNYSSRQIQFNISTGNIVEKIEYSDSDDRWKMICTKCNLINKKISFGEGGHLVKIKATDACENVQEKNVSFFIDSKEPAISKMEPRKNSVVNGSRFYIKYIEDNLKSITLYYGSSSLARYGCESGRNKECVFNVSLSSYNGQWIEYYFELNDSVNSVKSQKKNIFVDTSVPNLMIYSPININYTRRVFFNISVTNEDARIEYSDNNGKFNTLCGSCDEYVRNLSYFKKGEHNVAIRATDKAGNTDIKQISFDIT